MPTSTATAVPSNQEGRLPPLVIFEACSAFTHVSACLFARSPKVTFTQSTSTHSLPPASPWLLPAERPICRVVFAPIGDRRLARRTEFRNARRGRQPRSSKQAGYR